MNNLFKIAVVGAFILLGINSSQAQAESLNDETIYAIFDQANMADIATGRLGWKKSSNPEVRKLAKMVITDHSAVQQMGRDVATEMGILGTPPAGDASWASQAEALNKLDKLTGEEFDKAYVLHEIAYHTAVINAINTVLLPAIKNEKFKGLVLKVLPGFEHHLRATKKVADQMGITY